LAPESGSLMRKVWLPPVDWQNQITAVTNELPASKGLEAETIEGIDALFPSILDKAFRGEL
jgi:hypothetical protein